MFVGREKELKELEKQYQSDHFAFSVIYGRRRVGKTTLIKEFCKSHSYIYMMALESSMQENLQSLSKAVLQVVNPQAEGLSFNSFEQLFSYLSNYIEKERMILVIDEFPYLARSYPTISSLLQKFIDHEWQNSKLFLILCGSSMSFMENQVLGYQSPLYGRRTSQIKVQPFTYIEAARMFPNFNAEEQAILFSFTGGIPEYLARIQSNMSIEENIKELFLSTTSRLYEEPANLMKQELRDPATYNAIIEVIANGASRLNEIATKTHMDSGACSNYIQSLIALGILQKEKPVNEASGKKTIYRVRDQMFRFWYTFIYPNISLIELGLQGQIYEKYIQNQLSTYMGYAFEDICRQYMQECLKKNQISFFQHIGRWWGNHPRLKRQEEIDILAIGNTYILGECKWRESLVDVDVIRDLLAQGEMFANVDKEYYVFAKRGFSEQAKQYAQEHQVQLRTLADIYSIR